MKDPVRKENGMVVTAHSKASEAGKNILQNGGNAIDAAIAVQFTLAVVYPTAGNIGGGGFMVAKIDSGYHTLDFREKAPLKAGKNLFLGKDSLPTPKKSLKGHLASGVPGTVDGMFKLHEKWGTLPMDTLLAPAIQLAKEGFAINKAQAKRFNNHLKAFKEASTFKPKPFTKGYPWQKGDRLRQPTLAKTFSRMKAQGAKDFYSGKTAQHIVNEMQRCDGLINHKDLKQYKAKFRDPIEGKFKGYEVITMGAPSGGICLLQLLGILDDYPLGKWGIHSRKSTHLVTEAEKRVYADRAKHLGDPAYYPVPTKQLISEKYLDKRMQNFSMNHSKPSSEIFAGDPIDEGNNTTHFSIVDQERNAVSITTTLNTQYGSKVWVGQAGFFLNSEMNDFSLKPGYPNTYGLIGGKANAIEPGKRMQSSMTPTIVERDGELFMVTGSPGGSTIITTVLQNILNTTVYDLNMQEAVSKGRYHHQWKPDYILTEMRSPLPFQTITSLISKGHWVLPFGSIGSADAVLVKPNGILEAGADPRGNDQAKGY